MKFSVFERKCKLLIKTLTQNLNTCSTLESDAELTESNQQQALSLYELTIEKNTDFQSSLSTFLEDDSTVLSDKEDESLGNYNLEIESLIIDLKSKLRPLLPNNKTGCSEHNINEISVTSTPSTSTTSNIRLPKLQLKSFDGKPSQWIVFYNLFKSTVHNNQNLSDVEKFQYLLSSLQGDALSLVKSLPLTNENYSVAHDALVKRYHNPRVLQTYHLNQIIDIHSCNENNVNDLRNFISKLQEHSSALSSIGLDIIENNPVLLIILMRKFSLSLKTRFETRRTENESMPSPKEFMDFLEAECSYIENANLSQSSSSFKTNTNKHVSVSSQHLARNNHYQSKNVTLTVQNNSCIFCNDDHIIYHCSRFKELSCTERFDFIKSHQLCTNCFSSSHMHNDCTSKFSCKSCGKRHHTLLHRNEISGKQHFSTKDRNSSYHCENNASGQNTYLGKPFLAQPVTTNWRNDAPRSESKISASSVPFKTRSRNNPPDHSHSHSDPKDSTHSSPHTTMTSASSLSNTLLGTALVKVSSPSGHSIIARALLDSASNRTIINEDLAQKLFLKRHFSQYVSEINGISSTPVRTKGSSHITVITLDDKLVCKDLPVLILNKISSDLPSSKMDPCIREKLVNFHLADPNFDQPGAIQMIIGADLFMDIIKPIKQSLGENMPYALETIFGFVIIGRTPFPQSHQAHSANHLIFLSISEENSLHKLMPKFWQIEEPPEASKLTPDEIECEQHFENTHSRCSKTGKYIVRLPFKENPSSLGQSYPASKKRFLSLENKLKNELERQAMYTEAMNDYLSSGHMSLCDQETNPLESPHYVIPHLGVYKDTSSTTRLRIVFDASCKTTTGKSLNDVLHVGPKLQSDICSVIMNFRLNQYVFTTDVKQMFRSIDVHENDKNFQLLLWRDDPTKQINVYKMNTVTFGIASSPYLANRVIKQLCIDESNSHPQASKALKDHIYVDDLALGAQTLEEALYLQRDIIQLLEKGNFFLRKWTANHKDLLVNIPIEHQEQPVNFRAPDEPLISVLGLQWVPSTDSFTFKLKLPSPCVATKRSVLSTISQIWDPCGLVAPVILLAKSLMQAIWTLGCEWDTPLPNDLSNKWHTCLSELPLLGNLSLPRYLHLTDPVCIELHGFCDASETGYAACVYIRTVNTDGEIKTSLILSKTKVAPLKNTSLPRLELCGALLLVQLLQYCSSLLTKSLQIHCVYAWSDSTITLNWIGTPPHKLKTYVANRVAQIQELLPGIIWSHVPSSSNPADGASRGLLPSQLLNNSLWWTGPEWLLASSEEWPRYPCKSLKISELPEVKLNVSVLVINTAHEYDLLHKYSSWSKLQRVMSFVLRFIHNCSAKEKLSGNLTVGELKAATFKICQLVQQSEFHSDKTNLILNKPCSIKLERLAAYVDESNLIRVGGRLKNSCLSKEAKNPILLPKKHAVTNLIIDYYHNKYLHAGPQLVQSIISQRFWILSARSVIRNRVYKCITCFRTRPTTRPPKMADLPQERTNPAPPFKKTGVDYAGPFDIKVHTLRRAQTVKAYICIFICFVTKAVHIEVACDLTADTFIGALTRFTSRRGLPSDIYLDNATNFIGANNQISKIVRSLLRQQETRQRLHDFSLEFATKFHFIPPSAPHYGGLWESAVKRAKHHLKRVMGSQLLTLEEFQTLVTRIEAILNCRPLTPLSSDPSELNVLTPGHFLIGRPLESIPEENFEEIPLSHLKRWQRVQSLIQHFWTKWKMEYLHSLQQRSKWTKDYPNLKINDVVLIQENSPPQTWPLGRVIAIHPGSDGVTRVVSLKTVNGELKRPVVKLSPLPFLQ